MIDVGAMSAVTARGVLSTIQMDRPSPAKGNFAEAIATTDRLNPANPSTVTTVEIILLRHR